MLLRKASCSIALSLCVLLVPSSCWAILDIGKLQTKRNLGLSGEADTRAFTEAMLTPALQTSTLVKIPGLLSPRFEVGYSIADINENRVRALTDSGTTPSNFQNVYIKGGLGLPLGFYGEVGASQIFTDQKQTSVFGTGAIQVLDFATWFYTDWVPAMTLDATIMMSTTTPRIVAYTGQMNMGAYHRDSEIQFAYSLQYTGATLPGLERNVTNVFIRNGFSADLPIAYGISAKAEVFFPHFGSAAGLAFTF